MFLKSAYGLQERHRRRIGASDSKTRRCLISTRCTRWRYGLRAIPTTPTTCCRKRCCVRTASFISSKSGTNCRAWMLTILFNNFRNGYRKSAREQPASSAEEFERKVEGESLRIDPAGSNPEAFWPDTGWRVRSKSRWTNLPEEFREAILLVDVEEFSYQEVSGVLNIPIGTVKSRVSRGRAILARGVDSFAKERGIIPS